VGHVIGITNGTAVGFAAGPAAEKGATIVSGLFAGTPFYFIGISILAVELIETRSQHRSLLSDVIPIALTFLIVGIVPSIAQSVRFIATMQLDGVALRKKQTGNNRIHTNNAAVRASKRVATAKLA
jgi:hypothetical protein